MLMMSWEYVFVDEKGQKLKQAFKKNQGPGATKMNVYIYIYI